MSPTLLMLESKCLTMPLSSNFMEWLMNSKVGQTLLWASDMTFGLDLPEIQNLFSFSCLKKKHYYGDLIEHGMKRNIY